MDENKLFACAFRDDAAGIEDAIRAGADPNALHPRGGHPPLQVAAQQGSIRALGALLAGGANPNLRFTWVSRVDGRVFPGRVALMYAASDAVVEKLVSAGAALEAHDQSGWTPVACAIEAICVAAFRALLGAGARTDVTVMLNETPASLLDLVEAKAARISKLAGTQLNPRAAQAIECLEEMRSTLMSK